MNRCNDSTYFIGCRKIEHDVVAKSLLSIMLTQSESLPTVAVCSYYCVWLLCCFENEVI